MNMAGLSPQDWPVIFAKQALLAAGWSDDVRLTLKDGVIDRIEPHSKAHTLDTQHREGPDTPPTNSASPMILVGTHDRFP
jgi:hypothetical protein